MSSIIVDSIANIGFDAIKDKISDAVEEAQVKQRIINYLNQQQKLNFQVSREEEIDFGGIADYIRTNLMDDVKQRFYGNAKERGAARQRILEATKKYATANTKLSVQRVEKMIGLAIDILSDYYRRKVDKNMLYVTNEIEDTIKDEHDETRALIAKESEHLKSIIQDNSVFSIDHALNEVKAGNISQVESQLDTMMNALSTQHTLFPDFGFRMTPKNKMVSFPLTDEARKKYPEKFKLSVSAVKLGDQPISTINQSVLDKSYRHQLPIHINVHNACKYLGNVLDPIQSETDKMKGAHAILKPPAFPPAFPCCVSVGKDIIVPYILLRTKEILDDNSFVITNEEQKNYHFDVSIRIFLETNKLTFKITPNNASNLECLHYWQFLKRTFSGEPVTVYALQQNEIVFRATVAQKNIDDEIDHEIEFLQKIVRIENYFKTSIIIPNTISIQDQILINHIYDLLVDGFHGETAKFDFEFELTEEVKKKIFELKNMDYAIAYSAEGTFSVFNQEFKLPIVREIECVRVDNLSRLKEKVSILDIGDRVKIVYVPGKNRDKCKYTDHIQTDATKSMPASPSNK